jgi:hypothetical protein
MQEGFEEVFGRNRTANLRSPTALAPPVLAGLFLTPYD